jgi:hypothetical protein
VRTTALSTIPGVGMVRSLVIDGMHTLDGGVIKLFFKVFIVSSERGSISKEIFTRMSDLVKCKFLHTDVPSYDAHFLFQDALIFWYDFSNIFLF